MSNLHLHDPLWLLALLLLPIGFLLRDRRSVPVLLVPFSGAWHRAGSVNLTRWPAVFAVLGLTLIVLALARPQKVQDKREVRSQGYDIMLTLDLSGSMLSEDYERNGEAINRLQAVKPVLQAFIERRPNDRIGIVVFSGQAYTLAPLTFDHDWLANQTERLRIGLIEDGTAIGDGLGVALSRLEQAKHTDGSQRKGAFIVLMTDGANNRGSLAPMQAAQIAKSRNIPIYTVGAGKEGWVRVPVPDKSGKHILGYRRELSDLDESALRDIADLTGGRYFRADDVGTIESAFRAIDQAQKIEFQAKSYLITTELFMWLAAPGMFLLLIGALGSPAPAGAPVGAAAKSTL